MEHRHITAIQYINCGIDEILYGKSISETKRLHYQCDWIMLTPTKLKNHYNQLRQLWEKDDKKDFLILLYGPAFEQWILPYVLFQEV